MANAFDVVVISAQGRGLTLACELQSAGLQTALLEMTEVFRPWEGVDWEGPFGIFDAPGEITELQAKICGIQAITETLPRGFCVLDNHGLVEFTSPLAEFLIAQAQKDDEVWLSAFLSSVASASWCANLASMQTGIPARKPWQQRMPTAQKMREAFETAEALGVQIFEENLLDLSLVKGRVESLQLDKSGIVPAHDFVWCLSQEDCEKLPVTISSRIYPRGVLKAQGCWVRFQYQWSLAPGVMRPPTKLAVIGHRALPWSHGNLLIIEDFPSTESVQVWIRIPTHSRFLRSYLERMSQQIEKLLRERWPLQNLKLKQMPLEFEVEAKTLGPTRQPLFDPMELKKRSKPQAKNWIEFGPETIGSLDLNRRLALEQSIVAPIVERAKKRQQKLKKEMTA